MNPLERLQEQVKDHALEDDRRFEALRQLIVSSHDSLKIDLQEIKTETKLTNHRVSRLENFRWAIYGALVVIAAIIVPLLVQLLTK